MGCSNAGYRTCLICSNVVVLFVGVAVLLLGLKMDSALNMVLRPGEMPLLEHTVRGVIGSGVVLGLTGASGLVGACYEMLWLLFLHILGLLVIIIFQFGVGVTIIIVQKTITSHLESTACTEVQNCTTKMDNFVLSYALPSAGLMMTIIFLEALMIYSAIQLYMHIKNGKKGEVISNQIVVQNVQMQSVPSPHPVFLPSSQPPYSPRMDYIDPSMNIHHPVTPHFAVAPPSPRPPQHQMPPSYTDVMSPAAGGSTLQPPQGSNLMSMA